MADCEQGGRLPAATGAPTSRVQDLQQKVAEVTKTMQDNIHKVMDRGVILQDVESKAQGLNVASEEYIHRSKQLKWKMWRQNMKIKLFIMAILIVLALVIWLSICKGFKCS